MPDDHKAYLQAVEEAFGADIDYGVLVKLYGAETSGQGHEHKYSAQSASALAKTPSPEIPTRKHVIRS